ncbi:MAG: ABC transporter permease [Pirellulaceae bacterium]|nr:ABC transporter permease [Pirellulaceae bacterium]
MIGYLLRRTLHAVITIVVAVSLIFVAMRLLPGNPLLARFGQHPDAVQMAELQKEYGWDQPLPTQLVKFFWQVLTTGDLGRSIARTNVKVSDELARRIPATVELTTAALLLAIPLGVAAGCAAAVWRGRWPDRLSMAASLLGVSIPVFFLAICLREVFTFLPTSQRLPANNFEFVPLTGLYLVDTLLRGRLDWFASAVLHLALPALVLATVPMAVIARITRSSMLEVLSADFIRTARAKGAGLWRVVLRHALPGAAVPITNIAGLQVGLLLSGAVLTETVFDWPGIGQYLVAAILRDKDYIAVQAVAIVIAAMFVTLNLLLDLTYVWLDPRIRVA